ncbi:mechanosensitive ion channel family protein [Brumicola nitratireducens]|uniref:Mechanosensitive ion channel family protein n=1 Tax=Glaciecola nitratireducens (strain JCM 12485 / KCTC 12276 / FR1064) TaxID=1085623 RepID=G4QL77_GLANF|nr:mechanosensitive ion channel domain-containing protein [Glaciecola nitratireducens]AEP29548.1 mechanosensitive ion channel family protein [Glaciecola nitratireducens FR1064]
MEFLSILKHYFNINLFIIAGQTVTLGQILLIPILVILGVWVTRKAVSTISSRLIAKGVQADLVHLVKRILYVLAIVMLAITTLDFLDVPITAFAFLSGAIAIGVGFGAQNIINNFISGWILMWERPIRIGDFLEVDNAKGRVEAINTRSTRIRRVDGVHLLIPNSKLLENTVTNWTLIDQRSRTSVRVGVAYGSDCNLVRDLITQAVNEQDDVLHNPEPKVIFDDFGDNSLAFEVYFWINASIEGELRSIRSNIRFRINDLFNENKVVISFPQRDVHLDGSLTLIQPNIK